MQQVMIVTAVNLAVLSVSRAQAGTAAAAHPEGSTVWVFPLSAVEQIWHI